MSFLHSECVVLGVDAQGTDVPCITHLPPGKLRPEDVSKFDIIKFGPEDPT